ncbi:MAG: substrate-binding domain-containing protein [Cytophagaceae bacterium]|nr:substrate-binding domain-containing protein [Cytophagaceae bacterium]
MKHRLIILLTLLSGACQLPPRDQTRAAQNVPETALADPLTVDPNEEYVMVTTLINLPLYVRHDQAAFRRWGQKMGVKTSIVGPSEWDVPAQIETIEQVIASRPAGLLINGTDPGIAQVINKAVDAGIPTVVYDSDIPGSRRHAYLGSDWYMMGFLQGERVAQLTGGKGKVAALGVLGMSNMEAGFRGLRDALKKHPGIQFIGTFEDRANVEQAAKITSDLIAAYPDLAAVCGFTSSTGPGIALAVKESGKVGTIKITTVDCEPEHLDLVRQGVVQFLVGQKRELFTWYGAQILFDMVHRTNTFTRNDARAKVNPLPHSVNTGLVEIDRNNVDLFQNSGVAQ